MYFYIHCSERLLSVLTGTEFDLEGPLEESYIASNDRMIDILQRIRKEAAHTILALSLRN